jgi:3-oxoadipate enol-lactonase
LEDPAAAAVGAPEADRAAEESGQASRAEIHPEALRRRTSMPKVRANNLTINYDQQGAGDPLVLIPFLAADYACYAFQVAEYAKHFTCLSLDLRGAGETDKPDGAYSTELFADDVAAFMQALKIEQAHVSGLSLGAAVGIWLAAKYPTRVKSLSLHSAWPKTDAFIRTAVEGWRAMANGLGSVTEMVILGIFPWCLTPELYAAKPDYIKSLADFLRSRPAQPLEAFLRQSSAVLAHDVDAQLARIRAPTQITFGRRDQLTSTRFLDRLKNGIRDSEVLIFEACAHAAMYETVDDFNQRTLAFLRRHAA